MVPFATPEDLSRADPGADPQVGLPLQSGPPRARPGGRAQTRASAPQSLVAPLWGRLSICGRLSCQSACSPTRPSSGFCPPAPTRLIMKEPLNAPPRG